MPAFSGSAVEGMELLQDGRVDEAAARFEQGLQKDPADSGCLLGLVRLHAFAHDLPSAAELLERLLALTPDQAEARSHRALLALEEGDAAQLPVLEQLANAPGSGLHERLNHARALSQLGKGDAAEAAFQRAIAQDPTNVLLHLDAADAALDRGETKAAVRRLTEATRALPGEPGLWAALGEAHEAAGDAGKALQAVDAAIALAPEEVQLWELRYDLASRGANWSEAVRSAEQLVKLAPSELQYPFQLGEALTYLGQLDRAEEILNGVVAQDPVAPEPLRALAEVFTERGDHQKAIALLEKAVALAPTEVGAANDLANLFFEEPDGLAKAARLLRPILAANPGDAITAFNLALALAKDAPKEALTHARSAAEANHPEVSPEARRLIKSLSR